ncbi:MAG: hypothetical protein HOV81_36790 [Kofleriaceae bacterium]|nr:hypothetical protein [Kofleriaceae bacterium]
MRLIPLLMMVVGASACGGATAESPLTVSLGGSHDATEQALKTHQFCLERSSSVIASQQKQQLYPRCGRTAAEHGDAWVIASYDGDRLVELRRYERYGDDNRAIERWNALVGARMKTSTPSDEALADLKSRGLVEPGTRSVKAFQAAAGTVVGVYLLTPSPPENANVLEKISYVK